MTGKENIMGSLSSITELSIDGKAVLSAFIDGEIVWRNSTDKRTTHNE